MANAVIPVLVLKRKRDLDVTEIDLSLCVFCQRKKKKVTILQGTREGKAKVYSVAQERLMLRDTNYINLLDNLQNIPESQWASEEVNWHKNCYGCFTSDEKLKRLHEKHNVTVVSNDNDNVQNKKQSSERLPRAAARLNVKLCIFCQNSNVKGLHNVRQEHVSVDILKNAKYDKIMSVRLAGVVDLVAMKAKYHKKCIVPFERKAKKQTKSELSKSKSKERQSTLNRLCCDLIIGLSQGGVYDMGEVWQQYVDMCHNENAEPQPKYVSRRKTFYDDVSLCIGQRASYVRSLDPKSSLLLYPSERSNFVIARSLSSNAKREDPNTTCESIDSTEALFSPPVKDNNLQELIHTALKLRLDLQDTPGHTAGWKGIDQKHVEKVVPDSLFLFLSVLFGGTSALDDSQTGESDSEATNIFSIAQDIVYGVSKHRKLTPKHIGLGLTLHQATRSEILVDLFHSAGHSVGIETIRRIDTSIATDLLDKCDDLGGIFIPDTIAPYSEGKIILSSCDNIDVLEETLDGKNTFHSTQMMLWQRGPPCKNDNETKVIGRQNALKQDTIDKLHKLDKAVPLVAGRPKPFFDGQTQIDVDSWFEESSEHDKAHSLNLLWLLCRMHNVENQHVPSWSAFNETRSTVDPPITVPGMLPILQAKADDNDTMTTVMNKFKAISNHLGQEHTILVTDQPLYSRGKELIWNSPKRFEKIILLLGDLHILFNFLKAIGQHVENAGLEDIWVETGLYAQNSTPAMLDGKAYYRAVRGHTLAYEALFRIQWNHFMKWVTKEKKENCINIQVEHIANMFMSKEETNGPFITGDINEMADQIHQNISLKELMKEFKTEL